MPALDRILVGLAALAGLAGGGMSVYSKASLAGTEARVAVLESQEIEDRRALDRIEGQLAEIRRLLLLGDGCPRVH